MIILKTKLTLIEKGEITGVICATTITIIYYRKKQKKIIDLIFSLFDIAAVDRTVLKTARKLNFNDFEDTVVYASTLHSNCDVFNHKKYQRF